MYTTAYRYPQPYYWHAPVYSYARQPVYWSAPQATGYAYQWEGWLRSANNVMPLTDQGKKPYVVNINEAAKQNDTFRTAIWTGEHLQVTLMSIDVGDDIGLEVHPHTDQFLRIEEGQGLVQMGKKKDELNFSRQVKDDDAIMVPAGFWHNVTNTGNQPLKLYAIYAPPEHPFGTVHPTKADAVAAENSNENSSKKKKSS